MKIIKIFLPLAFTIGKQHIFLKYQHLRWPYLIFIYFNLTYVTCLCEATRSSKSGPYVCKASTINRLCTDTWTAVSKGRLLTLALTFVTWSSARGRPQLWISSLRELMENWPQRSRESSIPATDRSGSSFLLWSILQTMMMVELCILLLFSVS